MSAGPSDLDDSEHGECDERTGNTPGIPTTFGGLPRLAAEDANWLDEGSGESEASSSESEIEAEETGDEGEDIPAAENNPLEPNETSIEAMDEEMNAPNESDDTLLL